MSILPNLETLPGSDEVADPQSAEIIDLQEYIQEHRPVTELGEIALSTVQPEITETETKYYPDKKRIETAKNDQAAFAALTNEYTGLICYLADNSYYLKGGSREDLIQEGLFGFYKAVRDYDGLSSSFENFAILCIKRQIIAAIEAANRLKHQPLNDYRDFGHVTASIEEGGGDGTLAEMLPNGDHLPEDIVIANEGVEGLVNFLSTQLSPLEFGVISMINKGESYEAMAEELNVGTKAIDNALTRARRKISKYLQERELRSRWFKTYKAQSKH